MFPKILKWTGIVLGGLIVLAVLLVGVLFTIGNMRLAKKYDVQPQRVAIPTDEASIAQGRKWAAVLCADCHGADFSGMPLVDDPAMGFIPAPNLTSGEGGIGGEFTDQDWILALRDGVDPHAGRAFIAMPSMNFFYLSDRDLGAIVAYMKTIPPVDHDLGQPRLSFMGKALLAAGGFGKHVLPAEVIAHTAPRPSVPPAGVNAAYGEYLVRVSGCRDCHGENLTGGKSPEPGSPHAPDVTSGGVIGAMTEETFITLVRTQKGIGMPWLMLKPLDDPELEAIFLYLKSMPGQ